MKILPKSKKGGIVGDIVEGTGFLIVTVIIVLVIVTTLLAADILNSVERTESILNESVTTVNETGVTLTNSTLPGVTCSIVSVFNATATDVSNLTNGAVIDSGNYTQTNCVIAYSGPVGYHNNSLWNVTYNAVWDSKDQQTADAMSTNFTSGVDNISEKIPTILLLAAVVLLFGVLVLLVARSRQMGIGSGTSL